MKQASPVSVSQVNYYEVIPDKTLWIEYKCKWYTLWMGCFGNYTIYNCLRQCCIPKRMDKRLSDLKCGTGTRTY